ncbi:MAG: lysoplasmalogenase [Pseudolysinimonas sp.]
MPAVTDDALAPAESHGIGWRIGWTLAGFAPFVAISAVHLATKFAPDSKLEVVTKALEIPSLALALGGSLLTTGRKPRVVVAALLFIGLALSWLGDITLNSSLALGLGFFLSAHLTYIAMFQLAFPGRRPSWWALLAIPWFLALVVLIGPQLGPMLPSVVIYSAILGVMAIWSTRGTALTALGAVLFVASDTVLAFRTFTPQLQDDIWTFVVMATYLAAQAFIAMGILNAETGRREGQERLMRNSAGNPAASSILSWPSTLKPQRS